MLCKGFRERSTRPPNPSPRLALSQFQPEVLGTQGGGSKRPSAKRDREPPACGVCQNEPGGGSFQTGPPDIRAGTLGSLCHLPSFAKQTTPEWSRDGSLLFHSVRRLAVWLGLSVAALGSQLVSLTCLRPAAGLVGSGRSLVAAGGMASFCSTQSLVLQQDSLAVSLQGSSMGQCARPSMPGPWVGMKGPRHRVKTPFILLPEASPNNSPHSRSGQGDTAFLGEALQSHDDGRESRGGGGRGRGTGGWGCMQSAKELFLRRVSAPGSGWSVAVACCRQQRFPERAPCGQRKWRGLVIFCAVFTPPYGWRK